MHNVVVLGSGPAGLTAAIYLARANLSPVVVEGPEPGGQLMITTEVENYPGFADGIQGPELMKQMRAQAARFGTSFLPGSAQQAIFDDSNDSVHRIITDSEEILARSVVIATGASALWLGLPNEVRLRGKGVSACATCDGFFFRGKVVGVVGGGDTALEEAMFLTRFASKVFLIHRRDSFRASKIMQERVMSNPKIELVMNSAVADILGENSVQAVELMDMATGGKRQLELQGLFVAIGHRPNSEIFKGTKIEMNEQGYLMVENENHTRINGVFVAGDIADHEFRQAVTAAGSGCKAAILVERYLESLI